MKRLLLTLVSAAIASLTSGAEETTKTYDFKDITSINAGHAYQVHITYGKSDKVKVVYDDDMEKYQTLDIRYSEGRLDLYVKQRKPLRNWTNKNQIHVYLEMDDIYSIDLSGAAKATFTGDFKTENLDMDISGAASLHSLSISGESLEADISGASSANVTGSFSKSVGLDISGAAKMTLNADAETIDADISGASKLSCKGNFKESDITCSGASSAELVGKTINADYECSGASSIDAEKMLAKTAYVELTGASKTHVYASDRLNYNVSRSSKMTYFGDAELKNLNNDTNVVRGR